jgi:hypothetical protein
VSISARKESNIRPHRRSRTLSLLDSASHPDEFGREGTDVSRIPALARGSVTQGEERGKEQERIPGGRSDSRRSDEFCHLSAAETEKGLDFPRAVPKNNKPQPIGKGFRVRSENPGKRGISAEVGKISGAKDCVQMR